VKVAVEVGVELRQIYSLEHCSHHPNDAPHQIKLNHYYKTKERDPLSLLPSELQVDGEGTNTLAGEDR
jgi:hypothetical protein